MMSLSTWAIKWGVSLEALEELRRDIGVIDDYMEVLPGESEDAVQSRVRLEASYKGLRLWRNNVGALPDATGRVVRYGLCNESKRMNDLIKSSDLIGVRPRIITPDDVGTMIGQFVAREVKAENWKYKGTPHEVAQMNFIDMVNAYGGDAKFANKEGTL